jgi:hypothetical protein
MFTDWKRLYDKQRLILMAIALLVKDEESSYVEKSKVLALSGLPEGVFENILVNLLNEELVRVKISGDPTLLALDTRVFSLVGAKAPDEETDSQPPHPVLPFMEERETGLQKPYDINWPKC